MRSLETSQFALRSVDQVHWELSDLLWILNFMAASPLQDRLRFATPLFSLLQSSLEDIHVRIQSWIREEHSVRSCYHEPLLRDQQPPREVQCLICSSYLPAVMFLPCGHVSCYSCSTRLFRCPFCRAPIVEKHQMFL